MFEVAEYRVKFAHSRLPERLQFHNNPLAKALTVCVIEKKDFSDGRGVGEAWCSRKDQFSYSIGRKIALARALKASGFDKPTRSLFWEAYFKKRGKVE